MAEFVFSVLGKLASPALQVISLPWGEIKSIKETMSTIEAVLLDAEERQTHSEALEIWLQILEDFLNSASHLLHEIECEVQLRSQGSAGRKLCRFFSSTNPLVFCFRIGHRIKKMRERIDEIDAERERVNLVSKPKSEKLVRRHVGVPPTFVLSIKKIRERVPEIIARIDKLNDNVTYSFFPASGVIGKQIVYEVACIVAVCMDPFFLYIPFLSHTKMCLGMNRVLWKVAVALRTVADFFTALILFMSIDRPQLSRCMSSIKSILLMCVKFLALAPIPQILFSEKFILKILRGYAFWNLSLLCQYGIRLVLIFQLCEQLKTRESIRTLVRFNAPVYLFLYLIVSHVIGASWYYLSIKRQLSCWNYACKICTGCIFQCDDTTTSTLNSTLYNQFCPINPPNAAVFDYGIYLNALQSRIVEEEGVLKKCLRCFFWGLRNLSSFGSNLHTSTNDGETFFAIIISALALILLIYIIGNIQGYSELEGARSERIVYKMELTKELIECLVVFHNLDNRTKKSIVEHIQEAFKNGYKSFSLEWLRINHFLNDVTKTECVLKDLRLLEEWVFNGQPDNLGKAKKWLSDNNIPHDQNNIFLYLTCRLKGDEDVDLTSVLSVLPDESKWMTIKDLCFDTLKKVQGLQNIDEEWFKSISTILKPVIYPKASYIFRQGEPLHFIIFITNGEAVQITRQPLASGGTSTTTIIEGGKFFFGEELIKWILDSDFSGEVEFLEGNFFGEELVQRKRRELELKLNCGGPISTADLKSQTQVEAFVLTIEDLALISDFPVESRSVNSATLRVDSSSRAEEVPKVLNRSKEVLIEVPNALSQSKEVPIEVPKELSRLKEVEVPKAPMPNEALKALTPKALTPSEEVPKAPMLVPNEALMSKPQSCAMSSSEEFLVRGSARAMSSSEESFVRGSALSQPKVGALSQPKVGTLSQPTVGSQPPKGGSVIGPPKGGSVIGQPKGGKLRQPTAESTMKAKSIVKGGR